MNHYRDYANQSIEVLICWYDQIAGLWSGVGWWNSANALMAVINFAELIQTDHYDDLIENTFAKNQKSTRQNTKEDFLNEYYDDQLWFALAWIQAYNHTQKTHYLSMSQTIFKDTAYAWDTNCGGGVWWRRYHEEGYKNAIANSLFLLIAAKLYQFTHEQDYLVHAQRAWKWFLESGLLSQQHLVYDRLERKTCKVRDKTTWTYNQGVLLYGLAELYSITHDPAYLMYAQQIAHAAMLLLVDEKGILTEPHFVRDNDSDASQFKGIFMRHLAQFAQLLATDVNQKDSFSSHIQFIQKQADNLWNINRTPSNTFGPRWEEPATTFQANAITQTAALDVFTAAAFLQ